MGAADSFGDESGALEFSSSSSRSGGGREKPGGMRASLGNAKLWGADDGAKLVPGGGERRGELCAGVGAVLKADPQADSDCGGGEGGDRDRGSVEQSFC